MSETLLNELSIDDLPGDLQEIAHALGMDVAKYFVCHWGGVSLYIPSFNSVLLTSRNRRIIEEWNGKNEGELSNKYKVSRRRIYELIKDSGD